MVKRLDPDRLVLHQDGGLNTAENSDFRNGPTNVWEPGSFPCDAPFVAHEYLNLSVKQDPRLAAKFTGVMLPPVTLETRDQWLAKAGLDRCWGDACQDAAHGWPALLPETRHRGRPPRSACGGYDFWTIVDVVVRQGDTYMRRGYSTHFGRSSPTAPLPKCFASSMGQTRCCSKPIPKFGSPFQAIRSKRTSGLPIMARHGWKKRGLIGRFAPARRYWRGALAKAVTSSWAARAACASRGGHPGGGETRSRRLGGAIHGWKARNTWDFWLFPKRTIRDGTGIAVSPKLLPALGKLFTGLAEAGTPGAERANLLISEAGSPDATAAMAAGKRILLINQTAGDANVTLGWWSMGNQVGTAFARHPALGDFPHEGYLSPLSFRILKQGRSLPLAGMRSDEMLVVGEGLNGYFLYAGEARSGRGRVLMTFGLDLLSGHPEGTSILDGLIRYAQSDAFNPKGEVTHDFGTVARDANTEYPSFLRTPMSMRCISPE